MTNAERFQPLLHELANCQQALELLSSRHIRKLGLTLPQFDILVTLGREGSKNCGELGDITLITKGTLTGVLDRLESKKLIRREISSSDRRSTLITLTETGKAVFKTSQQQHMDYLRPAFQSLDDAFIGSLESQLQHLRQTLQLYGEQHPAT